jgi:hypothetical protein
VQILDHHQQPVGHRGALHRVEHLLEQPQLDRRPNGVGIRRLPNRYLALFAGHETGEPRSDQFPAVPTPNRQLLNNGAKGLHEGSERERPVPDGSAVPHQRACPPIPGPCGDLVDEAGLAGAGLPTDQHRDRRPLPRLVEQLVEQTKLHHPPHKTRARAPGSHKPILVHATTRDDSRPSDCRMNDVTGLA